MRQACCLGEIASARLREPGHDWTLLASVTDAIYITDDAEEILWIAPSSAAFHPRAIVLPALPATVPAVGTSCRADEDLFSLGQGLRIDLRSADIRPTCPVSRCRGGATRAVSRLAATIDEVAGQSAPRGDPSMSVFQHLPDVRHRTLGSIERLRFSVLDRAVASLSGLAAASDLPARLEGATDVIGLGSGLTPSGDDFVGAFLFTLWAFESAHPGWIAVDWQRVAEWLQRVKELTNRISFTILADHACGCAAAPLHELLGLVLADAPLDWRVRAGLRVTGIGHSSGWDMLAGVRCACRALANLSGRDEPVAVDGFTEERQRAESWSVPWKEVVRVC